MLFKCGKARFLLRGKWQYAKKKQKKLVKWFHGITTNLLPEFYFMVCIFSFVGFLDSVRYTSKFTISQNIAGLLYIDLNGKKF